MDTARNPRVPGRLLQLLVATATALASIGLRPALANAQGSACGTWLGYHYAGQQTSHVNGLTECGSAPGYFGWNGINGQITTPASVPTLADWTHDHAAGFLIAVFNQSGAALQTGWYTGTIKDNSSGCPAGHCIQRNGVYGRYFEHIGSSGGYYVKDLGAISVGSQVTSRVVYNAQTFLWEVHVTYSGASVYLAGGEPQSGKMAVTIEAHPTINQAPGMVHIPNAYFGTSNPNTNQALRLHGANGWEPWDTSLLAQYTERFDEHSTVPGYFRVTLNSYYYFRAYSN